MAELTTDQKNELWEAVLAAPRATTEVDFELRGVSCKALVRVLTDEENRKVLANADRRAREYFKENLPKKEDIDDQFRSMILKLEAAETVYLSFLRIEDGKTKFFQHPDVIAKNLTVAELEVLFNKYVIVQAENSPVKYFESGDLDAWLDKCEQAGKLHPLGSLGWGSMTSLLSSLVLRVLKLRKFSSSFGWPLDDSSSESEAESETLETSSDK